LQARNRHAAVASRLTISYLELLSSSSAPLP
jgi:hypothetical protein